MLEFFVKFFLAASAIIVIILVMLQRGKGGGLAGALGGMGGQSAFGTKAGDLFTKITVGVASFWILISVFTAIYAPHLSGDQISATQIKCPAEYRATQRRPPESLPTVAEAGKGAEKGAKGSVPRRRPRNCRGHSGAAKPPRAAAPPAKRPCTVEIVPAGNVAPTLRSAASQLVDDVFKSGAVLDVVVAYPLAENC